MATLFERMEKATVVKEAGVMSKSELFSSTNYATTPLPILNIALSGDIDKGLGSGVTYVAGASKSFKTLIMLYMLKAYFTKYEDAVCIFYDNEFGCTPEYLKAFEIDASRILHLPITNIEELTFDIVQKLEEIKRKDHVFIMIDSLGNIASKKEVEDAKEEKGTVDMTRAKMLKKMFRLVTPHLTIKDIPLVAIQHVYKEQGSMYPKDVVSGGTGGIYSANTILIITKSQEKEGTEIVGWNFTMNIEKSRTVREKAKFPFTVRYGEGVEKYSGLMEIALEGNFVVKPSNGWYSKVDPETGEISDKKYRMKDTNSSEFWGSIIANPKFKQYIRDSYQLGTLDAGTEEKVDFPEMEESEEDYA